MPLATLPEHGPITTHLEGPHSHIKCHRVKVFVSTNPQTRLQCAQDGAIVVPVNDTQTQCTTSKVGTQSDPNGLYRMFGYNVIVPLT